ncbi:hypothetical protein ACS0TY_019501 [Phlomoides rotata]
MKRLAQVNIRKAVKELNGQQGVKKLYKDLVQFHKTRILNIRSLLTSELLLPFSLLLISLDLIYVPDPVFQLFEILSILGDTDPFTMSYIHHLLLNCMHIHFLGVSKSGREECYLFGRSDLYPVSIALASHSAIFNLQPQRSNGVTSLPGDFTLLGFLSVGVFAQQRVSFRMDVNSGLPTIGKGRKKSVPTSRRVWAYGEEKELVNALRDLVVKGLKCDNGFKSGYLNLLENMLAVKFPGLNSTTYHIDALPEVWAAHIKADPTARGMKNKSFPFYADWLEIFGNDRAIGVDSQSHVDARDDVINKTGQNAAGSTGGHHSGGSCIVQRNFCDKSDSRFGQIADTMGNIAQRVGSEIDACNRRGQVYEQLGLIGYLIVESRVEIAQYLCNNPKDMDLFFSLPDDAKNVLVNRIIKKLGDAE